MLKSGWLPLFAGYAAHTGVLDLMYVAIVVFAGGYLGDEIRFFLARHFGTHWVNKAKTFAALLSTARVLAQRYGKLYIFIYRYPKGLRTIGALPIGLTDMSWKLFTLLNFSSALLWTFVLVAAGYSFGASFDAFGISNLTTISILMLSVFCLSLYQLWRAQNKLALQSNKLNRSADKV
jgi:membrane protein DedA with SNARE-associated domain